MHLSNRGLCLNLVKATDKIMTQAVTLLLPIK